MTSHEQAKKDHEAWAKRTTERQDKSYLGDGAYVQVGSFGGEVVLTTENGQFVGNTVVLDEQGTLNLLNWLMRQGWRIKLGSKDDAYEGRLEDRET